MTPRIALAVAGLAAVVLPLPSPTILGIGLSAAGLVALWVAVASPGSPAPAVLIGAAALSWLTSGSSGWGVRLVALAVAVTVVHSAAALAAVVPARSRVPAGLAVRWAGWSLAAAAGGVLVVAATGWLPAAPSPVLATVAALAVLLAATGIAGTIVTRSHSVMVLDQKVAERGMSDSARAGSGG